jgi:hypothetical protein
VNHQREIAGVGVFIIAGILVWKGHIQEAMYLVLPTVGFFIGEKNGETQAARKIEQRMEEELE